LERLDEVQSANKEPKDKEMTADPVEDLLEFMDSSKQWQQDLISAIQENLGKDDFREDGVNFSKFVFQATEKDRVKKEKLDKERILEKLHFHNMEDRSERISTAHAKTFEWIFHDPNSAQPKGQAEQKHGPVPVWASFTEWLRNGEGLYWITGKPGSGKSTFMKFLFLDPRTDENLALKQNPIPIVKAGFYFWNSGTTMQMSQSGLLRTVLYQSLRSYSDLVPRIFPQRWKKHVLFGGTNLDWSWVELKSAFRALVSEPSLRFCFFIDGLDEYDGNFSELAQLLTETATYPNVMICAASRPELVFEESFYDKPQLKLEDLTRPDIHIFATEQLGDNVYFRDLQRVKPKEAQGLISNITDKASGVFLWVRLVVVSLLTGLRDGDTLPDLEDRLMALPSDLEALFKRILDKLETIYFKQAAKLFQLCLAALLPPSLITLDLADDDFKIALRQEVEEFEPEKLAYDASLMRRRLISRCKGLLEVADTTFGPDSRVHLLHRTVRDFFKDPKIWNYLTSATKGPSGAPFEPRHALCHSYLRQLKGSSKPWATDTPDETETRNWTTFSTCIDYCRLYETKNVLYVVNELDRVGQLKLDPSVDVGLHWTSKYIAKPGYREVLKFKPQYNIVESLFDFAFGVRLYEYVRIRLKSDVSTSHMLDGQSLLFRAVQLSDLRMIRLLFECGVSPVSKVSKAGDLTNFDIALTMDNPDQEGLGDILELCVEYGATWNPSVDGRLVRVLEALRHKDSHRADELFEKLKIPLDRSGNVQYKLKAGEKTAINTHGRKSSTGIFRNMLRKKDSTRDSKRA
jgi:hypothetical protein